MGFSLVPNSSTWKPPRCWVTRLHDMAFSRVIRASREWRVETHPSHCESDDARTLTAVMVGQIVTIGTMMTDRLLWTMAITHLASRIAWCSMTQETPQHHVRQSLTLMRLDGTGRH
ncbi:hypothetical protein K503DRAFT_433993 [Rhizopogon vinicolor AM-OR11-026]|uniref:Uncharacterized protein n=1 Tax=Rhizopogon vinicolor AM-OR11-026 TaxID=1314800 RepID=A0A1B7MPQ4_9AGAM|nr:hypothetical protein K503DRAFT_433993 [Rhizopogon vinicolor AM-OR11-026]